MLAVAFMLCATGAWADLVAEWGPGEFPVSAQGAAAVTSTDGTCTLTKYDAGNISTANDLTIKGSPAVITPSSGMSALTVVVGYKAPSTSANGTIVQFGDGTSGSNTKISANLVNGLLTLGWQSDNFSWGESNNAKTHVQQTDTAVHFVTLAYDYNNGGTTIWYDGANKVNASGLKSSGLSVSDVTLGAIRGPDNIMTDVEFQYVAVYDSALSAAEALAAYQTAKKAVICTGSVTPSVDGENNCTFTVTEDAAYNVESAATYNTVTFNVTEGKTLILSGATLTGSNGVTVNGGMVEVSSATALAGTLKGDGTLCYTTVMPSGLGCKTSAWEGTLWIRDVGSSGTGWQLDEYGSAKSTLRLTGVQGHLNYSNGTVSPTVELYGTGLTVNNGSSGYKTTLTELTGTGSLTVSGGSSSGNGLLIKKASGFTGSINVSNNQRYTVTIGGNTCTSGNNGKLVIASGTEVTVASGKQFKGAGGIEVNGTMNLVSGCSISGTVTGSGTLVCDGYVPSITLNNSNWNGTLWVKNAGTWSSNKVNTQLSNLPNYGNANSFVKFTNVAAYLPQASVTCNWTLILEDDNENGKYAWYNNNGWTLQSDQTTSSVGIFAKLKGDGTFWDAENNQCRGVIQFTDVSQFTGSIRVDGKNIAMGGALTVNDYSQDSAGTIEVVSGAAATIASGKNWDANHGVYANGTLGIAGTGSITGDTIVNNTFDLSGFTGEVPGISGALTLASGTTIKLPAVATLPYQIASSGDGLVDNVTIQIKDGATTTSAVKLVNGALSLVKSATISTNPAMANFSELSWSSVTSGDYLLTISGTPTLLNFDDISGVDSLKIVVQNSSELYVKGEMPATTTVEGLTNLTIADDATASFYAGYTRLYAQIGDTTTGNDAISATGTTISVADPMSVLLNAGNYVIARWLTPQKLSNGYGHVNTVSATLNTESTPGLTSELVYMADRIVLRVYDATAQAARGTIKIWPYGDSITEGYNANHSGQNYRVLLYQKLALLGYNVQSVGCYNFDDGTESEDPSGQELPAAWKWHSAKHGATAGRSDSTASSRGNLEENVDTLCAQAGNPDVVLLHIGINDIVSSDRNPTTVYASISNVISRLESNLSNSIIVVSTVLDVATAAQTGRQINGVYLPTLVDQLNEKIRNGMSAFTSGRVVLADLNDYVKSADDGIIYDGVHPDWWGYDQMAEGWLAAITDNFTADGTFNDARLPAVASSSLGAATKAELADYRKGFKRYAVLEADKNILPTLETTIPYTHVNSDAASNNLSKVAYFVEYVRADNNAHKWVWVDMDAFGTTIGDVGLPVAKHQQVVRHLHVKSNHGAIDDIAADSEGVTGFIEFSPFGYGGASGSDSGPKDYSSRYDWNDTLVDSNTYACMQVHRIISTSAKPGGQVLFAFNNWRDSSSEAEFGIGNFSQHFSRGNQTFDYTDTKAISTMNAAAYSVKRIEIWTKPTSEYQSNDLKGTANNSPEVATFADGNSEVFTLTIPGEGLVRVDQIVLGLRTDSETEINRLTTRQLAVYSGDTLLAMSDLMNGSGEKDMTTFFANGAAKQTFTFSQDCVLACGTGYTLKLLNASGGNGAWLALLESQAGAEDYSPIVNTTIVSSWRLTQSIYASKVYSATVSADVDAFGSLSFSPSLPTDTADRANADLLVNVTGDATLTIGDAMPEVGSIRFSIADGVTLTLADPANINAGEVVVYGPGTLAFSDSATFKTGTDLEFSGLANVALADGQVLTTTGDIVVGSSATLTLAPATIEGLSASLVSAALINGEIAFAAPDTNSDYSITVSATGVVLHRTTKAAFTYNPVPGDNTPTGWITGWGGESFATTSLRVGPSSDIPYVYHVASGNHPWSSLGAKTAPFSIAFYADLSKLDSGNRVLVAFGTSSNGLIIYKNDDAPGTVRVGRASGGTIGNGYISVEYPKTGYHLYTVTCAADGTLCAYVDDGSVYKATNAEGTKIATGAFGDGFQIGSTYQGNINWLSPGVGMALCAVRGYDAVLQPEEVETISQSFPATDGSLDRTIHMNQSGNALTIYSSTMAAASGYSLGISQGTLTIPSEETVSVPSFLVSQNDSTTDSATININGTLNINSTSVQRDVMGDNSGCLGVVVGYWKGGSTWNIPTGGRLLGENAYVEFPYSSSSGVHVLNVNGGEVKIKGFFPNSNYTNKGTINLTEGGTIDVSAIEDASNHIIISNFGYGTYRQRCTATVYSTLNFSGTQAQPTTLDPYGYTMTLSSMSGNGYITVADSSDGKGKVVFNASTDTFTGYVILTDENAANIDLSGYTGKVLLRGTDEETLEVLEGFAGTIKIDQAGTYDASTVDLSAAIIEVWNAGATLTTIAGREGNVTVFQGACRLMTDNDTFFWDGHVFSGGINTAAGATLTYVHSEAGEVGGVAYAANDEFTEAQLAVVRADNNIVPYYKVFKGVADGDNMAGTLGTKAHWGNLPEEASVPTTGNVAFRVDDGKTLTVTIDNAPTFDEIQVIGEGKVVFQGEGAMAIASGLYITSTATNEIVSAVSLTSPAGIHVQTGGRAVVKSGTSEIAYAIPYTGGAGDVEIASGAYVSIATCRGKLEVKGNATITDSDASMTTLTVNAGGVVNVATGVTLTAPTLAVNGTVNMTSTSVLSSTTSLSGAGTVNWNGKNPDLTVWNTCSTWNGTNAVSNLSGDAQRQIQNWGRNGSYVKLTDVRGWLDHDTVIYPEIILENGTAGYGIEISNGSTQDSPTYFRKLSGSGTFKQTGSGGNQRYVLRDVSDFTGSIEKTDTVRVLIIDATTTQSYLPAKSNQGHMFVANITAKIGDGKGWSVESSKNIDIAGTATVEMLGSASMSGPITFQSGATLKFDAADGTTAPLTLGNNTATWPADGSVTLDISALADGTAKVPLIKRTSGTIANFAAGTVTVVPPTGSPYGASRWTTYTETVDGDTIYGVVVKPGTIFSVY